MDPFARDKYKLWGILFVILLLAIIPAEIFLLRSKINPNQTIDKNTSIGRVVTKESDEGTMYFINLVYDPNKGILKKLDSGTSPDRSSSLDAEPTKSDDIFNCKVEVLSPNGQRIFEGWVTRYKDVITLDDGNYHFRVITPYIPGSKLNIFSLDNKKLLEDTIR